MADQRVNIKVSAEGASRAKRELRGVEGAISKMGKAVGIASTAYFGATGLINGLSSAIQLAGRQEQAERGLSVALGRTSNALLNQAKQLQRVTTFGDEAIITQQAFLASLDFSETQIKDIINASVDLSEATGISLESAVRNTAKTFSGLSGELGELIPQLRDLTTEEMKAGKAVEIMADLFGGTATAQAQTLTGSLEQMKNALGDAGEAIGNVLAPAVIGISKIVTSFANGLSDIINFREGLAELAKDFKVLSESEFQVIQLEQALKDMTKQDILAKIQELGLSINDNDSSFKEYSITTAVLTEEQRANAEMANMLIEAYKNAPEAVNNTKTAFDKYLESQRELLLKQEEEKANVERLKKEYPKLAESLGLVKKASEENTEQSKLAKMAEDERFITSLSGARSLIKSLLAEATARFLVREFGLKGLVGLATGSAGAMAISLAFDQALPKFAQGGIVQGDPSRGDVVPVMATAGELILNQAQQENLVNNSGITINISAPLVDETVVDSIIPAIERAKSLGTA